MVLQADAVDLAALGLERLRDDDGIAAPPGNQADAGSANCGLRIADCDSA
jgi:hypothetical protein